MKKFFLFILFFLFVIPALIIFFTLGKDFAPMNWCIDELY